MDKIEIHSGDAKFVSDLMQFIVDYGRVPQHTMLILNGQAFLGESEMLKPEWLKKQLAEVDSINAARPTDNYPGCAPESDRVCVHGWELRAGETRRSGNCPHCRAEAEVDRLHRKGLHRKGE